MRLVTLAGKRASSSDEDALPLSERLGNVPWDVFLDSSDELIPQRETSSKTCGALRCLQQVDFELLLTLPFLSSFLLNRRITRTPRRKIA